MKERNTDKTATESAAIRYRSEESAFSDADVETTVSVTEAVLDPDNTDPIVLEDEDGNEYVYDQIATITLDGSDDTYAILEELDEDGNGTNEGVVFLVDERKDRIDPVRDRNIADKVFEKYFSLIEEDE